MSGDDDYVSGVEGLQRWCLDWAGPYRHRGPMQRRMADGYWTPWHLADAALHEAHRQIAALHLVLSDGLSVVDPEAHPAWVAAVQAHLEDCHRAACEEWNRLMARAERAEAQLDEARQQHRCSDCGYRWAGQNSAGELCGDCWRLRQAAHARHAQLRAYAEHKAGCPIRPREDGAELMAVITYDRVAETISYSKELVCNCGLASLLADPHATDERTAPAVKP